MRFESFIMWWKKAPIKSVLTFQQSKAFLLIYQWRISLMRPHSLVIHRLTPISVRYCSSGVSIFLQSFRCALSTFFFRLYPIIDLSPMGCHGCMDVSKMLPASTAWPPSMQTEAISAFLRCSSATSLAMRSRRKRPLYARRWRWNTGKASNRWRFHSSALALSSGVSLETVEPFRALSLKKSKSSMSQRARPWAGWATLRNAPPALPNESAWRWLEWPRPLLGRLNVSYYPVQSQRKASFWDRTNWIPLGRSRALDPSGILSAYHLQKASKWEVQCVQNSGTRTRRDQPGPGGLWCTRCLLEALWPPQQHWNACDYRWCWSTFPACSPSLVSDGKGTGKRSHCGCWGRQIWGGVFHQSERECWGKCC